MIDTNNIQVRNFFTVCSELINQLRAQMGAGEVVVTPSSSDFADKVATETTARTTGIRFDGGITITMLERINA